MQRVAMTILVNDAQRLINKLIIIDDSAKIL